MKQGGMVGLALLIMGLTAVAAQGQIPAAPAVPGVAGVAGGAQQVTTIWQKIIPSKEKCQQLKQDFCAHPMGQMISTMMIPYTAFSGGLISPCCPPDEPNPDDLLKSSEDPAGAAAKIKADEAGAKERRANMRYLGTVDCHYWPEAEGALITGLRTDKNECVRWEAALSLGKGCCCTRKTIEALRITVIQSEKDGNPYEKSERVRAAALRALNHCLKCFRELPKFDPKERPATTAAAPKLLPEYFAKLEPGSEERIVAEAREALAKLNQPPKANALMQTGNRTVAHIIDRTAPGSAAPPIAAAAVAAGGPVRPVAAPANGAAPAAAKAPAPKGDLLQMFRTSQGGGEPPVAGAPPRQPAAGQPVTPPTGNRDLFQIFRNSVN